MHNSTTSKTPRTPLHTRVLSLMTCASLALGPYGSAGNLPSAPHVTHGQVNIASDGTAMHVQQMTSNAIVNWESFGIGQGFGVFVNQPSVSAAMLSRVVGSNPSSIFGTLQANGIFYLVNPNGVYFGPTASVDVGSLIVSTLNISDADFLAGRSTFEGLSEAGITNDGALAAVKRILLLSRAVENRGTVKAPQVAVAAGGSVVVDEVAGSTIRLKLPEPLGTATNAGMIDASGKDGGQVVMRGATVRQAGTVQADGSTGHGGSVSLTATDTVTLASGSATTANAGETGNGGQVLAVADSTADFQAGAVAQAKAGAQAGDGGLVEVSGKTVLIAGQPDASAPNGAPGTFLVDPTDITIARTIEIDPELTNNGDGTFTGNAVENRVLDTTIETLLNSGTSVTLDTAVGDGLGSGPGNAYTGDGNIVQNADAPIDFTGNSAVTLTLIADQDIVLNGGISTGGAGNVLNVALQADEGIDINAALGTNGGTFTTSSRAFDNTGGPVTTASGVGSGNVSVDGSDGIVIVGGLINTAGGTGTITLTGGEIQLAAANTLQTESGAISIPAPLRMNTDSAITTQSGTVTFGQTLAGQGLTVNAGTGTVTFSETANIASLNVAGSSGVDVKKTVIATGDLTLASTGDIIVRDDFISAAGDVSLAASGTGEATQTGGIIQTTDGTVSISGNNVTLINVDALVQPEVPPVEVTALSITATETATISNVAAYNGDRNLLMNGVINAKNLNAVGDIEVVNHLTITLTDALTVADNVSVHADANKGNEGTLTVTAPGGITTGTEGALRGASVNVTGGVMVIHTITAKDPDGAISVNAERLTVNNEIDGGNDVSVTTTGNLSLVGSVHGMGDITLTSTNGGILDDGDAAPDIEGDGVNTTLTLNVAHWAGRVRDNDVEQDPGDGPVTVHVGSIKEPIGNALDTENIGKLVAITSGERAEIAVDNIGGAELTVGSATTMSTGKRATLWVRNDADITLEGWSLDSRDNAALIATSGDVTVPNTDHVLDLTTDGILTAADLTGARTLRLEAPAGSVVDDSNGLLSVIAERLILKSQTLKPGDIDGDTYDLLTLLSYGAAPGKLDITLTNAGQNLRMLQTNRNDAGTPAATSLKITDLTGDGDAMVINGNDSGQIDVTLLNGTGAAIDGAGLTIENRVFSGNGDITFDIDDSNGQDSGYIEATGNSTITTADPNDGLGNLASGGGVILSGTVEVSSGRTVTLSAMVGSPKEVSGNLAAGDLDLTGENIIFEPTATVTAAGSLTFRNARLVDMQSGGGNSASIAAAGSVTFEDAVRFTMASGTSISATGNVTIGPDVLEIDFAPDSSITAGDSITVSAVGNATFGQLTAPNTVSLTTIEGADPGTLTLGNQISGPLGAPVTTVTLNSGDSIVPGAADPDILASAANLTAMFGIGTAANPLQLQGTTQLDIANGSSNAIVIDNAPGADVTNFELEAVGSPVTYTQAGHQLTVNGNGIDTIDGDTVGGSFTILGPPSSILIAQDVNVRTGSFTTNLPAGTFVQEDGTGAMTATGDVDIQATDIQFDKIDAANNNLTLQSAADIVEHGNGDAGVDLVGAVITLTATDEIGSTAVTPGLVEMNASTRVDATSTNFLGLSAIDDDGNAATNADLRVGLIQSTAPGTVVLSAENAVIDTNGAGNVDVRGGIVGIASGTSATATSANVDLDTDVGTLTVIASNAPGDVVIDQTTNLTVAGITTANGDTTVTNGATLNLTGPIDANSTPPESGAVTLTAQTAVTGTAAGSVEGDDDVLITAPMVNMAGQTTSTRANATVTATAGDATTGGIAAQNNAAVSGPNVTVNGNIVTTNGTATVTATDAAGTATLQGITAGSSVTVLGPGGVTATNPITSNNDLVSILSSAGPVNIDDATASTTLTVAAAGATSTGNLEAGNDINVSGTSITVNGNVTSHSGDALMNPTATDLTITGTTTGQKINFQVPRDTRVGPLVSTAGGVTITSGGLVDLNGNVTATGNETTAIAANGGNLTMADGILLNADSGNVELSASGNILLSQVTTTGTTVIVGSTGGAIVDNLTGENPNIVSAAGGLTMTAVTGIGGLGALDIDTTVATVTATVSGDGDVGIHDTDGLDLQGATAADGSVSVTAQGGNLTVSGAVSAADAGAADDHDVFLNAGGDMAINAGVNADRNVSALAYDNITVANMVFGTGRLELRADWDFDAGTFDAGVGVGVGALTQTAGLIGSGTEELVAIAADGISLAGAGTSVAALQAVNGDAANTAAASGNINVVNSGVAGGELVLDDLDAALPYAVRNFATDGTVTINVDSALTANHRVLSQDAITLQSALNFTQNSSGVAEDDMATYEANAPISILAAADIGIYAAANTAAIPAVYSIAARGAGSNVQLDAANDVNISQGGVDAAVYAGGGLTITANNDINAGDLASGSSGHLRANGGNLVLDATGDVNVSGNTQITADGNWNVIGDAESGTFTMAPNTLINADTGTATLSADLDVTLGSVLTTNNTGNAVRITSRDGGIYGTAPQTDIIADSVGAVTTLTAEQHIGTLAQPVTTTIDTLDAYTENGNILIRESNGLTLRDVQAGTGALAAGNGDITVLSVTGDVLADYVAAALDVVNITAAAGAIDEVVPGDATADIIGATINLLAADNIGQKAAVLEIDGATAVNATSGGPVNEDIVLTDTINDLPVGTINAGRADVVLVADDSEDGGAAAAITDAAGATEFVPPNITAADANLTANTGIGSGPVGADTDLDVNVDTLTAQVLGVGPISIDEVDDVLVNLARTADGSIDIRAGFAGAAGSILVGLVDADQAPGNNVTLRAWDDILDHAPDLVTDVLSSGTTTLTVRDGLIGATNNPLEVVAGQGLYLQALNPAARGASHFWAVLTGLAGGSRTPRFVDYIGAGNDAPAFIFWNSDIIGGRKDQMREYLMQKTEGYRMAQHPVHVPAAFREFAFLPAEMAIDSYWHSTVPLLDFRSDASMLRGIEAGTQDIAVARAGDRPFVWNFEEPPTPEEEAGRFTPATTPDAAGQTTFWNDIMTLLRPRRSGRDDAPLQPATAGQVEVPEPLAADQDADTEPSMLSRLFRFTRRAETVEEAAAEPEREQPITERVLVGNPAEVTPRTPVPLRPVAPAHMHPTPGPERTTPAIGRPTASTAERARLRAQRLLDSLSQGTRQ